MKTIKTREAKSAALNWLVAAALGYDPQYDRDQGGIWYGWTIFDGAKYHHLPDYTTNPVAMQPIMERMKIGVYCEAKVTTDGTYDAARRLQWQHADGESWEAVGGLYLVGQHEVDALQGVKVEAPTMLLAAARCVVLMRCGETAEVPDELA